MIAHVAWRLSRRAAVNLWRAPLPSLVSVLTIALSLFIGASFVLGLQTAKQLLTSWGAQASITLYLDKATSDAQAQLIKRQAEEQAGDAQVTYVDRGMALQRLRSDMGDLSGALEGLSQNPLPPSLEITPRTALQPAGVRVLAAQLGQLPGVSEVEYGREWLDKLEALGRGMRAFGAGALLIVLGAALLVVANTIRLAVYARRDEIEIMKLVGATDGYVRAPFLLEGALQGLIGAGMAAGAIVAVQHWLLPRAQSAFAFASGMPAPHLLLVHGAALLGIGTLVGLFGSWLAVARFLRT
ncbi:MAG TPA: permease-like cell division protein FtsX [Myxococcales bacterium]|nr:permease-like cell division protein FtsX [Myxococcales bacterium]